MKNRITYPTINVTNDIKKTADQIIEAGSYKTYTAYVLKSNKALRDSTNIDPLLDNNAKQPLVIIQINGPDEGEGEGEQDEGEQDEYEGQQDEDEDEEDAEEQDEEGTKLSS